MAKTPKITHPAKNAHEVPTGKGIISDVKEIIGMANAPEGHSVLAKSRADVPINPEAQVSVSQKELGHIENNISVGGGQCRLTKSILLAPHPTTMRAR